MRRYNAAAMPIREYACRACGHEFETLVRGAEVPVCPKCESEKLEKKLSVFAAQTKSAASEAPTACSACGHPGGPGACAFSE